MTQLRYQAKEVDRRYNNWHYTLGVGYDYMDLDGLEWCRRCWSTFLLVETSTAAQKPTIVLRTLAKEAGKESYLLVVPPVPERGGPTAFDADTEITYRQLTPTEGRTTPATLGEWFGVLHDLRQYHYTEECAWRLKYEGRPLT
jgi:hypothetical protein